MKLADVASEMQSLLDAPSPAVLLLYRADGEALVSPVWFACMMASPRSWSRPRTTSSTTDHWAGVACALPIAAAVTAY